MEEGILCYVMEYCYNTFHQNRLGGSFMYEKLLLAVDGSEHSKRAATYAVSLAEHSPTSHVTILHVLDYDRTSPPRGEHFSSEQIHEQRKEKLLPIRQIFEEKNISCEIKFLHGEAGPIIVDHANKSNYDVVVIGSRGINTLQEMVLGSVSHKVAKRVNAPVLLIK